MTRGIPAISRRGIPQPPVRAARSRRHGQSWAGAWVWPLAAVLAAGLGAIVFMSMRQCCPPPPKVDVLFIGEKTTQAPGLIPEQVRARARLIADAGMGSLEAYAVGRIVAPVGEISLEVLRGGVPESNGDLRHQEIGRRLYALAESAAAARTGARGFDLAAALQVAADESQAGRREIWLATTVLSTSVPPLDMAKLTAADPKAAVEDVRKTAVGRIDLSRVDLHPLLLAPVKPGPEPLSPDDEAWRAQFIVELATALGARVSPPVRVWETPPPWPLASEAALAAVKQPPLPPDRIDASYFEPNKATLLNRAAVRRKVDEFARAYRAAGARSAVRVTGFCARFGSRQGARELSLRRAEVIAGLLVSAGVPRGALRVTGVGWDRRATPGKSAQDKAQRVVLVEIVPSAR